MSPTHKDDPWDKYRTMLDQQLTSYQQDHEAIRDMNRYTHLVHMSQDDLACMLLVALNQLIAQP